MPTYVYCLLTASREPRSHMPGGLDGIHVRVVHAGPVDVLASDVAQGAPTPTIERIRAHDEVVRWALEQETPLPARFGQTFDSDAAVIEAVRVREHAFTAALERVRGLVEMTVRVKLSVDAGSDRRVIRTEGLSGRDYLAWVRERQRRMRAWQEEADFLRRRVADHVRAMVHAEASSVSTRPMRLLAISHLVERDSVRRYREELSTLAESDRTLQLRISGPWAPYSFADMARV